MSENKIAEDLLYECIRELSYNRETICNHYDLHASANAEELVKCGMKALNIRELGEDTLDAQRLAEWNAIYKRGAVQG